MKRLTATELENLRDTDPMAFHRELEQWDAGEYRLNKDTADDLGQRMIDERRCKCGDDLKDGEYMQCTACRIVHSPRPKDIDFTNTIIAKDERPSFQPSTAELAMFLIFFFLCLGLSLHTVMRGNLAAMRGMALPRVESGVGNER